MASGLVSPGVFGKMWKKKAPLRKVPGGGKKVRWKKEK